ncbi:hypothetical protein HAX54_004931, partial [Datura stramonium]|nr:hypothetical protein [Datura stramonium]
CLAGRSEKRRENGGEGAVWVCAALVGVRFDEDERRRIGCDGVRLWRRKRVTGRGVSMAMFWWMDDDETRKREKERKIEERDDSFVADAFQKLWSRGGLWSAMLRMKR